MSIVVLFIIAASALSSLVAARSIIKMRKKLINAEESKQHLKAGLQIRLTAEEKNRRDLEEKLYRAQKEYKRLEVELKLKTEEEEERCRVLKEEEKQLLVEKQICEKAEKEKIEGLEAERFQLEKRLSQAVEETKHLADELQKAGEERDRIEEEQRKLQEREQHWQAEKEVWDKAEKEMTEKFESQMQELEEEIHKADEERNFLKETIRELVKKIEDLHQIHTKEKEHWMSEIELGIRLSKKC